MRLGLSGRLEWIAISTLKVDHTYQRQLNAEHVTKIVQSFMPHGLGIFQVSERIDGFYLMDGQHRQAAILQMELHYAEVQCLVYEDLSELEEAELFICYNEGHLPVNALHTFRTRIQAQFYNASEASNHLERFRISLVGPGVNLGVRQISAFLFIEELEKRERLLPVLEVISTAWPEERGAYKRLYLDLVDRLLGRVDKQTAVTILRQLPPMALDQAALKHQDRPGLQLRSYLKVLEGYVT